MKQITTKRIFAYIVHQNLKRTPPKEFPDITEMVTTVDEIIPAFEKDVLEFVSFRKQADEINNQLAAGSVTQEDATAKITQLQKDVRKYEIEHGDEPVTVDLETATLGTFNTQFERWGKVWFDKIDDFVAFKKNLNKANQSETTKPA